MSDQNKDRETVFSLSWFKSVFTTYFFRLIGLDFLFLICCIPIITIPAALCGMFAVIHGYYRNIYSNTIFKTFFTEFFSLFFLRTLFFWLIFLGYIIMSVLSAIVFPYPIWIVTCALFFVILLLVVSWFLHQTVYLDISCKNALKNAFLLTAIENNANFFLILIHAVFLTILIYGWPLSGFLLILLPIIYAILTTGTIIPVLKLRLVRLI